MREPTKIFFLAMLCLAWVKKRGYFILVNSIFPVCPCFISSTNLMFRLCVSYVCIYVYIYIFRLDIAFKHVTALSLSLSFYRNLFIYLIFISIFTINLPIGLKCHVEQLSSSSRIIDISLIEKKKKKEKNFRNYEFEHGFSRSFNINHRRRRCFIATYRSLYQ